ncbi:Fic family protein [Actinoplanes sp. NEAU-A12]|uniref:Fic family protein n=1 Tax=Actinoplanes sandaracinus TaxID=3045177 RepID=A0ABT6X235_9ACTN|nr:Fic family protein [Actinoplanes sandaracinus]MDI6106059.1 Fic family protein [Actinoplanes sandaracinus]
MPDQLTTWLRVREQVLWRDIVPHLPTPIRAVRDGFTAHAWIGEDQRRRSLLLAAYDDVRCAAATSPGLTTNMTARWNGMLRGIPAPGFRRGPAFAKKERERYGLHADTQQRYESCLAEATDLAIPVAARAARAYLDVAFFHPYDDGNARLGGLVLHFVLLNAGVELDEVGPILTTVRRADDSEGAAGLAHMVRGIATATHRRWVRCQRGEGAPRPPGNGTTNRRPHDSAGTAGIPPSGGSAGTSAHQWDSPPAGARRLFRFPGTGTAVGNGKGSSSVLT